mgnify:CR=1 FL=1
MLSTGSQRSGSEESSETLVDGMRAYLKNATMQPVAIYRKQRACSRLAYRILNHLPLAVPTYLAVFAAELTGRSSCV